MTHGVIHESTYTHSLRLSTDTLKRPVTSTYIFHSVIGVKTPALRALGADGKFRAQSVTSLTIYGGLAVFPSPPIGLSRSIFRS